ncbi:hypothetical protein [Alicyclobacillus ferrooxydans]|uniref:Uncharacterized protein n=1 Tax=Alicyclobacillus ferrooxydans TaxID=471514 RepID=A0A0P9CTG2_9BACL|nr:hypothetical protein [Alicyclobacillus ferrooxydans]KPV42940.1 hypothetical protein AN477_14735 [Alicyclobacillus ferrooxydans]
MFYGSEHYAIAANVIRYLDMSILAEQVFCSIVAEMQNDPNLRDRGAWSVLEQANRATTYYRSTAGGHLRRLLWGADADTSELFSLTVGCLVEAKAHDKEAEHALVDLDDDPAVNRPMLNAALKWHSRRKIELKHTALGLRAALPRDVWETGVALAKH